MQLEALSRRPVSGRCHASEDRLGFAQPPDLEKTLSGCARLPISTPCFLIRGQKLECMCKHNDVVTSREMVHGEFMLPPVCDELC
jgi:hypothetical protein